MNSGSLRFYGEFLKRTIRVDNFGVPENDWSVFASVRASIKSVSTTEKAAFEGKMAIATHTITCRFVDGIENTMRFRLLGSGRIFEITDIRTDYTGQRRLTIKAVEVVD